MKYPYLPDFHAAFLVKAGASMRDAMFIPGWLLFVSFVALLFLLNRRVGAPPARTPPQAAMLGCAHVHPRSRALVRACARPARLC
jgi:hypothetical protein